MFHIASAAPEVKKLVNSIVTMVKKSIGLVQENEEYLRGRHSRLKTELRELKNSQQILKYLRDSEPAPQFVDGKN